ncbi:hypothetical protein PENTCL1PPCAC_18330 [Pristionchus entomophagus]|uniref:non-specific serine/threonine protein kinase n=1 Tax=Pristionchus entomophagus TaxID=358040 RepID=A0AAV5TP05_9BILA|nr:hypothetical protein PENTCL1PPCAC_18330 [Pristionchus entomophagus]
MFHSSISVPLFLPQSLYISIIDISVFVTLPSHNPFVVVVLRESPLVDQTFPSAWKYALIYLDEPIFREIIKYISDWRVLDWQRVTMDVEMKEEEKEEKYEEGFGFEMAETPMSQGAEARIFHSLYLGKPSVVKQRFAKKYRHSTLDERLNKHRVRAEVKGIMKAKQVGVETPALYMVDGERNEIVMERVEGCTAKEWIEKTRKEKNEQEFKESLSSFGVLLGTNVGKLHAASVVHGDLTTSNVLLRDGDPARIVLIDFGLSSQMKITAEEKGVDLYVLERAIASTHHDSQDLFLAILQGYEKSAGNGAKGALEKLDEVRLRGRKRDMIG